MNPPFGGRNALDPWLDKLFLHGNGIALVPDRTSAPWFRKAWASADLVLFTPKLHFHRPDGFIGKSPSNGTALLAAGAIGQAGLLRAAEAGLGILRRPILDMKSSFSTLPSAIVREDFSPSYSTSAWRQSPFRTQEVS
jgi:hypothetical protein